MLRLVFASMLWSCTPAALLPAVAVRGYVRLRRRQALEGNDGVRSDLGVNLRLAWSSSRRQRFLPPTAADDAVLDASQYDLPACTQPLICQWLTQAERAELRSWGLTP